MEAANIPNNIYLIGMPGSGKSTLGKGLATALGIEFYDLDHFIENYTGRDINAIFSEDGEQGFRLVENQCLKDLSDQPQAKVIATGGGTPCFLGNMEYINQQGVSIFLDVPLEIITARLLQQGTDSRPLLKNMTENELLGQLHTHFLARKTDYRKAFIHLEGSHISTQEILGELKAL